MPRQSIVPATGWTIEGLNSQTFATREEAEHEANRRYIYETLSDISGDWDSYHMHELQKRIQADQELAHALLELIGKIMADTYQAKLNKQD